MHVKRGDNSKYMGVDAQGAPTTDPHQVKSLTPFAGPKGYGMALVVDVLSGILASAAFGPHISKCMAITNRNVI